jgi:glycosyltransferase involved in cell wall biosynthesis
MGIRAVQVGLDVLPEKGGTTTAVRDFHRALGGTVVSFTAPHLIPHAEDGVCHIPTRSDAVGRLYALSRASAAAQAARAIRHADLVVIHGLYRYHAQWAWAAARQAGVPHWVVPHGMLDPYVFTYRAWQKRPWMALVGRPMISSAASVIFATAREQAKAARYAGDAAAAVVPWPVERVETIGRAAVRARARARFNLPGDARVLLFVGRLHPIKRLRQTIDAVRDGGGRSVRLMIAGPDSEQLTRCDCERYAAEVGAVGVCTTGPVYGPDKQDVFLAADALINLSEKENFGYAAAEALACGLPVILSPGNDLAPELAARGCGWLLRSYDDPEAAAAVRAFAHAPESELREMGARGQAWARTELSRDEFAKRVSALAERSAGRGGR